MFRTTVSLIVGILRRTRTDERGLETVEYAILIGAVAVAVAAAALLLGDKIVKAFNSIGF